MNTPDEKSPQHIQCPRCEARERIEQAVATYSGFPVSAMKAYPLNLAARMIGVTYKTIYRLVEKGELRMSPGKLIAAAELDRYLAQDARRHKQYRPRVKP